MSINLRKNKIIVALDVADFNQAKNLIDLLEDDVDFFKVGLELFVSGDYFKIIEYLAKKNKRVFADLKFFDISNTVASAIKNLQNYPIEFLTIHAASIDIMKRAVEVKNDIKLLAVTVLTNLDKRDLADMGCIDNVEELVLKRAKLAQDCGVDGIICSALEALMVRKEIGDDFLIVTPGIRLTENGDDQKRVVTPETAIKNGANYLVVGRPITRAENPQEEVKKFLI